MANETKLQKIKNKFKELADDAESWYPNNIQRLDDSCTISENDNGTFTIHVSDYLTKDIQKAMFNLFDQAIEEVEKE